MDVSLPEEACVVEVPVLLLPVEAPPPVTVEVPLSAYTDNGFAAHLQGGMMRTSASARDR